MVTASLLVGSVAVAVATGSAPSIVDTSSFPIGVNSTCCSSVGVPILETSVSV